MNSLACRSLLLILIGLPIATSTSHSASAQISDGVCSYSIFSRLALNNGSRLVWRKKCTADYFNSGNESYTTNNGTIWFRLNDTRNNSYKYNGRIWYRNQSNKYSDCTFERGGECFTFTPFHWTNSSVYVLICSFPFSCPWQASFKPHSLGQSVEWKPVLYALSCFQPVKSPTRWGNQLNGNY